MKCPYCEKEMRIGYLHNYTQPVQWIPEESKRSPLRGDLAKDAVQLGNDCGWFSESRAQAHYCPACKMVILPVK